MEYHFNFSAVWASFDTLLYGLGLGLLLALVSNAIGAVLGLVLAFLSISPNRIYRLIGTSYVTFIRNTPILVIILTIYFALPQIGIGLGKIESFVLSLAVYAAAYLAEVFRAGLLSVPKGLYEAGRSVGLRSSQIKFNIVLPLMFRNVLPSLSNNLISLFKDTSLAAAIAVPELTYYARKINVETFRVVETWMVASVLYVLACYLIACLLRRLEKIFALPI